MASSIRAFGFRQPIVVDEAGVIIAGHTRLLAARRLGLGAVPVHVASGLSEDQVRAYRLADNRTAEEAQWNQKLLAAEVGLLQEAGFDLALTGFSAAEIALMLGTTLSPEALDQAEIPTPTDDPITARGDRIALGRHLLVCGDATDATDWQILLGNERADAIWTDPPYAVGYVGKTKRALTIENDARDIPALAQLLRSALGLASCHLRPGAAWMIAAPHGPPFLAFATVATELGIWRQTLVWVKDRFVMSRQDFHWQQEVILSGLQPPDAEENGESVEEFDSLIYGWSPDGSHEWHGDRRQCTVWRVERPAASREHPTMKPVRLIAPLLSLACRPDGVVLDPFAGSGSTLMACEATGRQARCIELSPAYCDVIVRRWEEATGEKAIRPEAVSREMAS